MRISLKYNVVVELSKYFAVAKSLLRVPTFLLINLYLLVGMLAATTLNQALSPGNFIIYFILCSSIIACWYINGSALNDIADVDIDKINLKGDKERPLVVKSADLAAVRRVANGTAVLALVLALSSIYHLVICAALLILNKAYSNKPLRISRRGGLAPLLLPLGYVLLPYFLGYFSVSHKIYSVSIWIFVGLYIHFLGRIILKDYRDIKGDKAHGKKTFLINHGNSAVCFVSAISILISSVILATATGDWLGPFVYSLVIFLFLGLGLLFRLSKTDYWQEQKPILASFGRSMTGLTASLILGLVFTIKPISTNLENLLVVLIVMIYAWSARQTFEYNTVNFSKH